MKKYSLKAMSFLIVTVLLFALLLNLTGCLWSKYDPYTDLDNPVVESECGFFYIQLYKDDGYALALELTDLGKQQEILAMPAFVEGLPVTIVGMSRFPYPHTWAIESDSLKKIYIPYTVTHVALGNDGIYWGPPPVITTQEEVVFLSAKLPVVEDSVGGFYDIEYSVETSKLLCVQSEFEELNLFYDYNFHNSPNSGYYWYDYISGENLYLNPPSPARQGHIFLGWYLEPKCLTLWDGTLPESAKDSLDLYAGWGQS